MNAANSANDTRKVSANAPLPLNNSWTRSMVSPPKAARISALPVGDHELDPDGDHLMAVALDASVEAKRDEDVAVIGSPLGARLKPNRLDHLLTSLLIHFRWRSAASFRAAS